MLGPADWVIWISATLFEAAVVVSSLYRGVFRRYFFLNTFVLGNLAVSVGRYQVLEVYGRSSAQYYYFYFYSDALLIVLLYFGVISLYSRVFQELKVERYVRLGAILLLVGTACFSYAIIEQSTDRIGTRFAYELSQNLYFVGLVLTYVLWGAILKLRETRALLVQLVLSLGIYFSAYAATFAISNLRPDLYSYVGYLLPVIGCLLPLAWAYAIWRVPEETRLAPAQLATVPR